MAKTLPEQQQLQVQRRRTGARPPVRANSCRGSRGKPFNSHQCINIRVNGAHQHTIGFLLTFRGDVPYVVTLFSKFQRAIKC